MNDKQCHFCHDGDRNVHDRNEAIRGVMFKGKDIEENMCSPCKRIMVDILDQFMEKTS